MGEAPAVSPNRPPTTITYASRWWGRPTRSRVMGLACALLSTGCDTCRNDHPYVPYAIGEGGAAPSASTGLSQPAQPTPSSTLEVTPTGEPAPPSTTTWEHGDLRLRAPDGHHFEHGLFGDLDGDGKTDAVVIVRSFSAPTRFAAYVYVAGNDSPVLMTSASLPASPRALGRHGIQRVGSSALVSIAVVPADGTAGARRVAFVDLVVEKGKPLVARPRLEVSVLDPKDAPALDVTVDASDRDGDGTRDLGLVFAVRDPRAPASARVAFFDRPAGFARDPEEPRASLALLAKAALAKAQKPKEAGLALELVASTAALARAVCPELPGARTSEWAFVTDSTCHSADALGDLALAEVVALANSGRPFSAVAAFGRWRGPYVTRPKDKEREAEKALEAALRGVIPREVRTLRAAPLIGKRHVPSWGPISFAPGAVEVLTAEGVVRVDLATFEERKSDSPVWPTALLAPDGSRLVEVYDACRGGRLRATFAPSSKTPDAEPHDVPLPVETPLVPPCTTSRGEPADVSPISWGPAGLELFVAGEPLVVDASLSHATSLLKPSGQRPSRGAASSPDGSAVALATPLGVVVRTPKGEFRVKGGGLGTALSQCTVADDASAIACLDGAKAVLALLPTL